MKQLVVAVALMLIGCSKQAAAPVDPNRDPASRAAVEKLEALRAEMCACTDAACTRSVAEARDAWLAASYGSVALSPEQQQARDVAVQQASECAAKLAVASPPRNLADQAIDEMRALTDEMCACRDQACANRVSERFAAMGEKHKDTAANEQQIKEASTIAEHYGKCMAQAMAPTP